MPRPGTPITPLTYAVNPRRIAGHHDLRAALRRADAGRERDLRGYAGARGLAAGAAACAAGGAGSAAGPSAIAWVDFAALASVAIALWVLVNFINVAPAVRQSRTRRTDACPAPALLGVGVGLSVLLGLVGGGRLERGGRCTTSKSSARISHPRASGERQAAGLSRQRGERPEAAGRHRGGHACYAEEYSNVHRGLHYLSNLATEKYESVRGTVARFSSNAGSEEEIVSLNSGTTEGITWSPMAGPCRGWRAGAARSSSAFDGPPCQRRALDFPAGTARG